MLRLDWCKCELEGIWMDRMIIGCRMDTVDGNEIVM